MSSSLPWTVSFVFSLLTCSLLEHAGAIQYSKPIVIRKGGVYQGNWQSLDPRVAAVEIATRQKVVIQNSNIQSKGPLIRSQYDRANIVIRNTRGVALNPGRPLKEYRFPGRFLDLEEFESLLVENNEMIGTSGIYLRSYLGQASKGQTIKILRNRAINIDGRYSTGPGQYSPTEARLVQFVQFNQVRHVSGAEIAWNEVINEPGKSRPEENINMYRSSGVPESRIKIHDNYIQGAYAVRPRTDEYSGGGINAADGSSQTAKEAAAYIRVYRNQIVNTSNVGIAVSAGHNIEVFENRVISSGYLPSGAPIKAQNVGLYVWDMHGDKKKGTFYNISVRDNLVGWAQPLKGKYVQNPFWFPDCPRDPKGVSQCRGNRVLPSPITQTMERQEYARWQAKLRAAGIRVGLLTPRAP
ncbi:hypothetical protein [Deinococcus sp. YIM 77859]|uniref:hypothetical protein n=1 Tax=Deinococcus sp. YIM 77859 TaxID=1540221 RepID=UPI0005506060|nr:hypothetical protein [Deinococcus sp. YIM 77859]